MDIQRINPREWNCSAAVFGDLVFLSGTVADDKSLDMKGQTAEVLKKIDTVLAKAGTNKSRILSATVYMADAGLKDEMNKAWMAGSTGRICRPAPQSAPYSLPAHWSRSRSVRRSKRLRRQPIFFP
jgi:Putative translation initiation inhibitor, yjgF family